MILGFRLYLECPQSAFGFDLYLMVSELVIFHYFNVIHEDHES